MPMLLLLILVSHCLLDIKVRKIFDPIPYQYPMHCTERGLKEDFKRILNTVLNTVLNTANYF